MMPRFFRFNQTSKERFLELTRGYQLIVFSVELQQSVPVKVTNQIPLFSEELIVWAPWLQNRKPSTALPMPDFIPTLCNSMFEFSQ